MNQLRNMGEATWYSFTQALNTFMGFLPALLVALIVLVVGWFIAGFLARLIARGLNAIGLERAVERSGIGRFIEQSGTRWTMSEIIAALIKWSIFLIFIQAAASLLGMAQITAIINTVILFIPKLIVALGIIVIGSLIARFVAGLVRGSLAEMEVGSAGLFAKVAQYAIIGFAIVAAFNQIERRADGRQHTADRIDRKPGAGARTGIRSGWARGRRTDHAILVQQGRGLCRQNQTTLRRHSAQRRLYAAYGRAGSF